MIAELALIGSLVLLKKRKSVPSIWKLFGDRTNKSELKKLFRKGKSGNVNDNDFIFSSGYCFTFDGEATKDFNSILNATYMNNQRQLRWSPNVYINNIEEFISEMCGPDEMPAYNENQAYWRTIDAIAGGVKFIWDDDGERRGIRAHLFGKTSREEKRFYKGIISKNGYSPEQFAETLSLDENYTDVVLEALRDAPSKSAAKERIEEAYVYSISQTLKTDKNSIYYEDVPF